MLTFHIITIFPEMIDGYVDHSIVGRAIKEKKIAVKTYNPRDFSNDKHRRVDDRPYGGGPGMVMRAEPVLAAVKKARGRKKRVKTIIFSPQGHAFTGRMAARLPRAYTDIILIAGRYEGIDARVKKILRAEEVSIGPYVLTGGELPALALVDAVARHVPGVLGKAESLEESRAASRELYTRPESISAGGKTYRVPKVLQSGDHARIEEWRAARDRHTRS